MNPPIMSKQEDQPAELLPCPGKRLQAAREAKKLDIATVAKELHLSRAVVHALEAEDFDKLPARVFVRGYYRNYARLVGVSEETINREFSERCPDGECKGAPPRAQHSIRQELHSTHSLIRVVTWSLTVLLLAALFWWGKNNIHWSQSGDESESRNQDMTAVDATTEDMEADQQDGSLDKKPDSMDFSGDDGSLSLPDVPVKSQSQPEQPQSNAQSSPGSVQDAEQTTENTVVPPEALVKAEEQHAPKPKGEVEIHFTGDCWVDVRDSTRQFKLLGTMRAGDTRKLGGKPPFSIIFGDYSAVKMTIDGAAYDLSVHAQGKTAKFKLDPAALAAN